MPTEYKFKKLRAEITPKIYKLYYKNETIDTASGSIVGVKAVSGMKLIKLQLILNILEDKNLKLDEDDKFSGLMLVHYFDASKRSKRKACVNDFINYLNVNRYPSRDDLLLLSHISLKDKFNSFSCSVRKELEQELIFEKHMLKNRQIYGNLEIMGRIEELSAMFMLVKESKATDEEFWKFFNLLDELSNYPFTAFGVQSINICRVVDLASLCKFKGHRSATRTYPSPFYGRVNFKYCSKIVSTDLHKKYIKSVEGKCEFMLEENLAKNKEDMFNEEKVIFYDESPSFKAPLHGLYEDTNGREKSNLPFYLVVLEDMYSYGTNSLHNVMNCTGKLAEALFIILARIDQKQKNLTETMTISSIKVKVSKATVALLREISKLDKEYSQGTLGFLLYHGDFSSTLRTSLSKAELLRKTLPRLQGNLAEKLLVKIYDIVENVRKIALIDDEDIEKDINLMLACFLYTAKVKSILIHKSSLNKTEENFKKNAKKLRIINAAMLNFLDYVAERIRPVFKSLSMLDLFVFSAHREKVLGRKGLCSAYLCDQPHEALHYIIKSIKTNFNPHSDAFQRAIGAFNCFLAQFFSTVTLKQIQIQDEKVRRSYDRDLEISWTKMIKTRNIPENVVFICNYVECHGKLPETFSILLEDKALLMKSKFDES